MSKKKSPPSNKPSDSLDRMTQSLFAKPVPKTTLPTVPAPVESTAPLGNAHRDSQEVRFQARRDETGEHSRFDPKPERTLPDPHCFDERTRNQPLLLPLTSSSHEVRLSKDENKTDWNSGGRPRWSMEGSENLTDSDYSMKSGPNSMLGGDSGILESTASKTVIPEPIQSPVSHGPVEPLRNSKNATVTEQVKNQYENLPYPMRDPDEDKKTLRITVIDNLLSVNQYCYRGRHDFDREFQVLIAGGGTGDSSTYLAVQTAGLPNVRVVYLDLSTESMKIAKERVRNQAVRLAQPNLEKNIEFRIGSLLDVEKMGFGKFDYVNCSGVLHHLADPAEGLCALGAVLKDHGAMGIMVYGQVGRTSVYQIQDMMRIINRGIADIDQQIRNTNLVLQNLPSSNLHKKYGRWISLENNPIEVYDLYLHSQDRAYTFSQLRDWVAGAGLNLGPFTAPMKPYLSPEYQQNHIPHRIVSRLRKMSESETASFSEYFVGNLNRYEFYVTKQKDSTVDLTDWDLIPSFSCYASSNSLKNQLQFPPKLFSSIPSFQVKVYQGQIQVPASITPLALSTYPLINDVNTMRDIALKLKSKYPLRTQESLRDEMLRVWHNLIAYDMIQFRHRSSNVKHLNRGDF